jgi:Tfp pilus assembly protein PilF
MKSKKGDSAAAADAVVRPAPTRVRTELALAAVLALVTFALYIPSFSNRFVDYDDHYYVTANKVVQKGLTREGLVWAFTTTHFSNWLPVTWLSHELDCELYGLNAGGHHATSALLHAFNAAALLVALNRMTGRLWAALAVASLWAVHPLRVESVAWVAERKDVLCGTFFMLALIAYVPYCRKPSVARYVVVALCHALGLMSKTMLVTLPCLLLLLDYWPLRRLRTARADGAEPDPAAPNFPPRRLGWLVVEKLPLVVLSLVASAWTFVFQKEGGAMWAKRDLTLSQRVANAFVSVPRYLLEIAWPRNLSVFYPHPGSWPAWKVAASVALVALLCVAASLLWRRRPYVTVGWFWFLGMLVPVSGVIQVGLQSMADRYTYLPSIGLIVALVWWVGYGLRRLASVARVGAALATSVALVALSVGTVKQQAYWEHTYSLFSHALDVDKDNWLALQFVGGVWSVNGENARKAGAQQQAAEFFKVAASLTDRSLQINPTDYVSLHNQGWNLYRLGRTDEAIGYFRKSINTNPEFGASHHWLGVILAQQGKLDEALPLLEEGVRLQPGDSVAHQHLAEALLQKGRTAEAVVQLKEALRQDPQNEDARYWLEQVTAPSTAPATALTTVPATQPGR